MYVYIALHKLLWLLTFKTKKRLLLAPWRRLHIFGLFNLIRLHFEENLDNNWPEKTKIWAKYKKINVSSII